VIESSSESLPKIGDLQNTLLTCQPMLPGVQAEANEGSVYYDGGFAVFIKPDTDVEQLKDELASALSNEQGWTARDSNEDASSRRSHWLTQDNFTISVGVIEREDTGEITLAVSASSPCFMPEPPYELGDKL
ncbi:hypothetical protein, partial [Gulosibacter bifidus]